MRHTENYNKYRNIDNEDKELMQSLELEYMPKVVDEKLEQVYKELPNPLPTEKTHKHTALKAAFSSFGAVAAAFLVLLGLNAVNPVLAEGIPLIGGIFKSINAASMNYDADAAEQLEEKAIPVTEESAHLKNDVFEVFVRNVYYDGRFLHSAVELISELDIRKSQKYLPIVDVKINGDDVTRAMYSAAEGKTQENIFGYINWIRTDRNTYAADLRFSVPEEYRLDELEIEYEFNILDNESFLEKASDNDSFEFIDIEPIQSSGDTTLKFSAAKDNSDYTEIIQTAQSNGAVIRSFVSSPAGVEMDVSIPIESDYGPFTKLYTKDGREISSFSVYDNHPFSEEPTDAMGMTLRYMGFDKKADEVILQIFIRDDSENQSSQKTAEFTIDLADKSITPTDKYNDKTSPLFTSAKLNVLTPTIHPTYRASDDELLNMESDYKLEYLSSGGVHKSTYLTFVTPNDYKEHRVELYVNDELRASDYTKQSSDIYDSNGFYSYSEFIYGGEFWENDGSNVYTDEGTLVFIDSGFLPRDENIKSSLNIQEINIGNVELQMEDTVTIKIYSADDNKLIHSETVTVTLPEGAAINEGEHLYKDRAFSTYVIANPDEL